MRDVGIENTSTVHSCNYLSHRDTDVWHESLRYV